MMEGISPVFNWDQTGISIIPGSIKVDIGLKRIERISDKQQITAVLSGSLAGEPVYGNLRFQATSLHVLPTPPLTGATKKRWECIQETIIPYVE